MGEVRPRAYDMSLRRFFPKVEGVPLRQGRPELLKPFDPVQNSFGILKRTIRLSPHTRTTSSVVPLSHIRLSSHRIIPRDIPLLAVSSSILQLQ